MASATPAPSGTLDFGRCFTYLTEDPDWLKKVLIGGASRCCPWFSSASRSCSATSAAPCATWRTAQRDRCRSGTTSAGSSARGSSSRRCTCSTCSACRGHGGVRLRRDAAGVSRPGRSMETAPTPCGALSGLAMVARLRARDAAVAGARGLPARGARPLGPARHDRRRLRVARQRRLHPREPRQLPARRSSSTWSRTSCRSSGSSSAASASSRRSSASYLVPAAAVGADRPAQPVRDLIP